jgi:hypothetical protein
MNGGSSALPNPMWILLIVAVLCIMPVSIRFFTNFFQAYILPHISLRRLAEEDHQFYAFMLVLVGSILLAFGLSATGPSADKASDDVISQIVSQQTAASSSPYKDLAVDKAGRDLTSLFGIVFKDNILVIPAAPLVFWFILVSFIWIFAKLFHTPITYGHFLRTMSYNGFIFGVAAGLNSYTQIMSMSGDPFPSWLTIVAGLLGLYAVVHFFVSLAQGLDISPAGTIVSLILALALIGGIGYFIYYQYAEPAWSDYWSSINSFDPSRGIG